MGPSISEQGAFQNPNAKCHFEPSDVTCHEAHGQARRVQNSPHTFAGI